MRWFYILQGFGALGAFIFIVGGGYYLPILPCKINLLLWLSIIPAIIASLVKLSSIKNHKNYK